MCTSGVDIGGVIRVDNMLEHHGETDSTEEEIPGAFEGLRALTTALGSDRVVIISKARETMQRVTMTWFEATRFFDRTGVLRRNVFFTRDRDGKGPIAAAKHVTVMVDDRLDCIRFVQDACPAATAVWFAGDDKVTARREALPPNVTVCDHWPTIVASLLGTDAGAPTTTGSDCS